MTNSLVFYIYDMYMYIIIMYIYYLIYVYIFFDYTYLFRILFIYQESNSTICVSAFLEGYRLTGDCWDNEISYKWIGIGY